MITSIERLIEKYPECRDPDICGSAETLDFYLNRRAEGMSHNFAAMLATQKSPGAKTEAIYFEGRHTLADQFKGNEAQLEAVVAAARARGYNPSPHDVYEPDLADDVGDPKAFIKPSGGLTQIRQVGEKHDLSCNGMFKRKRQRMGEKAHPKPLASDIVNKLVNAKIRQNPDLARKASRRDLAEEVRSQHGYSDAKRAGMFKDSITPSRERIKELAPPPADSRSYYRDIVTQNRKKRKKT